MDHNKLQVIGTGLNGLIGSRIVELLKNKYTFYNLSRTSGIDITDYNSIKTAIASFDSKIVLHAAAYTDVKQAEKDKELKSNSPAYKINVVGTQNVIRACEETNKKIIHISTDMVIGGDNMPEGGFTEESSYNPLNFYAQTKCEAEKSVINSQCPWVVIRPAYPYRSHFEKNDFVRLFINLLNTKTKLSVMTDRLITPTFIDDLASVIDLIITKQALGLYNTSGSQIISVYDAAVLIAKTFNLDESLISKTTRSEYLVGKPIEPFSSALNNAKIKELGLNTHSFSEGLKILKNQINL